MFLPRSSVLSSSGRSDHTRHGHHGRPRAGPSTSAGLAAPATTASAIVQVHYHYLAGRYRDLSSERGLGLSGGGAAVSLLKANQVASSRSKPSASSAAAAAALAPGLNSSSSTVSSGRTAPKRDRSALANDLLSGKNVAGTESPNKEHRRRATGSVRDHAKERLRQVEELQRRILSATDVSRLKWEAKSALLSSQHALAIMLLERSSDLGSLTSIITLATLYTAGVTRGSSPVVVLVYRDPLRGMAWALEAARLVRKRIEALQARQRSMAEGENDMTQMRATQLLDLLSRLARTTQAGAARRKSVTLPSVAGGEAASLWPALRSVVDWLHASQNSVGGGGGSPRKRGEERTFGPDDDEDPTAATIAGHLALLQALLATHSATDDVVELKASWQKVEAVAPEHHGLGDVVKAGLALAEGASPTAKLVAALEEALEASLEERNVPVAPAASKNDDAPAAAIAPAPAAIAFPRQPAAPASTAVEHVVVQSTSSAATASADSPRKRGVRTMSLQGGGVPITRDSLAPFDLPYRAQGLRRPSSVVSDSPSLMFPPSSGDEKAAAGGGGSGDDHDVFAASRTVSTSRSREEGDVKVISVSPTLQQRPRLASFLSTRSLARAQASVQDATKEAVALGATSADYGVTSEGVFDPTASLRRSQRLRKHGGGGGGGGHSESNWSISTGCSLVSAASTAWERNETSSTTGSDELMSASGYLRDISRHGTLSRSSSRRSISSAASVGESQSGQSGPAAPQLQSKLEQMLASSGSSSSISSASGSQQQQQQQQRRTAPGMPPLQRRQRTSSMASLSSFVSTASRQDRYGAARNPLMPAAVRTTSTFSIPEADTSSSSVAILSSLDATSSQAAAAAAAAAASASGSRPRPARASSALGSLRKLEGAYSVSTLKASSSVASPTQMESSSASDGTMLRPPALKRSDRPKTLSLRSFGHIDPTSPTVSASPTMSRLPGGRRSPDVGGAGSPAPASPALSTGKASSVRFDVPEGEGSGEGSGSDKGSVRSTTTSRSSSVKGLDAALAAAEEGSKLKTTGRCHNCEKVVHFAPVDRNGLKLCGRECRIEVKRKMAERRAEEESKAKEDFGGAAEQVEKKTAAAAAPRQAPVAAPAPPAPAPPNKKAADDAISIGSGKLSLELVAPASPRAGSSISSSSSSSRRAAQKQRHQQQSQVEIAVSAAS